MDIKKRIKEMSLDDLACQMTQTNSSVVMTGADEANGMHKVMQMTDEQYRKLGSVLSYVNSYDAKEVEEKHVENSDIPLLVMLDVIHGFKTAFPIPLALGCTFNEEIAERSAEIAGIEGSSYGTMVTFSPMVDLARDARWGRIMETTSEDAYLNGEMGKAFIRGYHKGGIACCVKHFAAYGAAEAGRDYNVVDMSEHTLREYYLKSYHECMKEKPDLVMTSFNSLNGIPSTGNKWLLNDVLRGEWGFDGVVISDYAAVDEMKKHRVCADFKDCARKGIEAGCDIEMCTPHYVQNVKALVEEGKITREQLETCVERILRLKEKLGLFENPYHKYGREVDSATFRAEAKKAAIESCVLLKNENGVLPLGKEDNVALIGPFADTKEIIGAWSCFADRDGAVSVKEGVQALATGEASAVSACSYKLDAAEIDDWDGALAAAKKADKIVLCVGEHQDYSGECKSRADIRIPKAQRKLIKAISAYAKEAGKPVIGVIFGGRPLVLTSVVDCFDAILYAWQPGSEGGNAIAELLYGEANPTGKTTVTFPRSVGQCPISYNHYSTGRPTKMDKGIYACGSSYIDEWNVGLFPFGFGLSYTQFEISAPVLSATTMEEDGKIEVRATVKNTGSRAGAEVVQMYIRDDYSELVRPVKELKGYKKVYLNAGEAQEVVFTIDVEMLKYYGQKGVFEAEKGTFTVMIGNSSVCLQSASFELV